MVSHIEGAPPYEGRLRKEEYCMRDIPLKLAAELVREHHYAKGGSNTRVYAHGLFHKDAPQACLGVAWWIPPTKGAAIASYDGEWKKVLSLSRLVIVPGVPKNAATFLLAQSVQHIREDGVWECLVTYADEWQGHVGTIYRASNWEYMGRTTPERVWVEPTTGKMVSRKAGPKTRTNDEMRALGYQCLGVFRKHKFRLLLCKSKRVGVTHATTTP